MEHGAWSMEHGSGRAGMQASRRAAHQAKAESRNDPILAPEESVHLGPLLIPLLSLPDEVHLDFTQLLLDVSAVHFHLL